MLKLMRLEWKKYKTWKYILIAATITLLTLGLLLLMGSDGVTLSEVVEQTGYCVGYSITEAFVNMTYLVFTSVMLATFIVSAYKNKTMNIMFSYPIDRKKVILAKFFDVCLFTFVATLLSKVLIYGVLFAIGTLTPENVPIGELEFWVNEIISSLVSVGCGCVPVVFGLLLKSSKSTVLIAFGVMLAVLAITTGNAVSFSSVIGIVFYIVQAAAAVFSIIFTVLTAEKKDV